MKQKLNSLQTNSQGDMLIPLESTDHAVICKVLNSDKTFFVAELEEGPGFYDHQSGRYLTKDLYLKGDDWEKAGKYIQGRTEAHKTFQELSDPVNQARKLKDEQYKQDNLIR